MAKHLASKVVSIALAEVGYHEKANYSQLDSKTANSGSNNWNKYAEEIDKKHPEFYNTEKNGYDWCDIFNDWCHIKASDEATARKALYQPTKSAGAGCIYSAQYYKSNGAWISRGGTPKPGDQIFFGSPGNEYHTGVVVAVDSSYVYTVEGNSGEKVSRCTYLRSNGNISGYGRPKYDAEGGSTDSAFRITADSKLRSEGYCNGDSKILATVKKGTAVTHITDDSCGWSKIKADGKTGWVQNTRLNKPGLSAYPTMTPGVAVYEKPDCTSSVLGTIKPGAPVTVRYIIESGTGKGWAEVAFPDSNGVGFVNADNLY